MKWFPHDTNMMRNRKVRKLIRTHGASGYGFWCYLLEKLYEADGDFQIQADQLWLEDVAEDLKLADDRTPIRILDTMAEVGLISSQLWAEHVIYSDAIAERGDQYIQKRVYERDKKRKQRAKKKAMSPSCPQGTKGQSAVLSPSYRDLDLDPDQELIKEGENNAHEDQPVENSNQISSPARKSPPVKNPEKFTQEFNQWWDTHEDFLRKVAPHASYLRDNKKTAWSVWNQLMRTSCSAAEILKGSQKYYAINHPCDSNGIPFGLPKSAKFLHDRKWEITKGTKGESPRKPKAPLNFVALDPMTNQPYPLSVRCQA